jgi:hypothetical protein
VCDATRLRRSSAMTTAALGPTPGRPQETRSQ